MIQLLQKLSIRATNGPDKLLKVHYKAVYMFTMLAANACPTLVCIRFLRMLSLLPGTKTAKWL